MFYKFTDFNKLRGKGTCFFEIQYCDLSEKKLFNINKIKHYSKDSLYVVDIDNFGKLYDDVLGYGVYPNLKEGYFDDSGITYFSSERVEVIKKKLFEKKPDGYDTFLEWLDNCHNGFYILGI